MCRKKSEGPRCAAHTRPAAMKALRKMVDAKTSNALTPEEAEALTAYASTPSGGKDLQGLSSTPIPGFTDEEAARIHGYLKWICRKGTERAEADKITRSMLAAWEHDGTTVTVRSLAEFKEWGKSTFGKWYEGVRDNPQWSEALRHYTAFMYHMMNGHLRCSNPDNAIAYTGTQQQAVDLVPALVESLDAAHLPEPTILFRYLSGGGGNGTLQSLEPGDMIFDPGFMSTSGVKLNDHTEVLLRIKAPAGTRGAYVGPFSAQGEKEAEVLLQAGTALRVDGKYVNPANGQVRFDVTIVSQTPFKAPEQPATGRVIKVESPRGNGDVTVVEHTYPDPAAAA